MSEARFYGLNYGHLGRPCYDENSQKWHFGRSRIIDRHFEQLGQPLVLFQPSPDRVDPHAQYANERVRNIKKLTSEFPELQPSVPLLPNIAAVSETLETNTFQDAGKSDLLAYGQADAVRYHSRKRPKPLVVIPDLTLSGSLWFVLLVGENLQWDKDSKVSLRNVTAGGGIVCHWYEYSSPVQQLVFAEVQGRSESWLAVRYPQAIAVLRPVVRPTGEDSSLDPNQIVTLQDEASHATSFCDVAFNPQNPQQIATIDERGTWSIWSLDRPTLNRPLWRSEKVFTGRAFVRSLSERKYLSGARFEWCTVCWIGNSGAICVASRNNLSVVVPEGERRLCDVPEVLSKKSFDQILELKTGPLASSTVFVLTQKAIFWLRMSDLDGSETPHLQHLLSWDHFRDLNDISLKLNVFEEHAAEILDQDNVSTLD